MSEREYGAGLKAWREFQDRVIVNDGCTLGPTRGFEGSESSLIEAALVREAEVDRDLSDEALASASVDVHPAKDVPGDWIARFTSNNFSDLVVTQGSSRANAILMLLDSSRMVLEHQATQIQSMVAAALLDPKESPIKALVAAAYTVSANKASSMPELAGMSNADLRKRICMTIVALTPLDAIAAFGSMIGEAKEEGRSEIRKIRRTLWAVWCAGEGWCPSHGAVESFEYFNKAEEAAARWRSEMPTCTYEVRVFLQGDELPRRRTQINE